MKLFYTAAALLSASTLLLTTADAKHADTWTPCGYSSEEVATTNETTPFECSSQKVPLCYEGICESTKEIDFFVRRRLAGTAPSDGVKRAVVLIQGGPGAGSFLLEATMGVMPKQLGDQVDIYTFDHRGTGRSEFLQCEGSRTSSPDGIGINHDELAACLDEMHTKYDGHAAGFSVTSAARDVEHIIKSYLSEHEVYLYGYSYGTYLTQRLMQFEIPQVKGYIFDGVDARADKGDAIESANSHWNEAIHAPSKRLLQFCAEDPECPLQFTSAETAYDELLDMYSRIDTEVETNDCLKTELTMPGEENGEEHTVLNSTTLRTIMFGMVKDTEKRSNGIASLAAVQACFSPSATGRRKGLRSHHQAVEGVMPDPVTNSSQLLYDIVVFSERWAQPAPTKEERRKFFLGGPFSADSERHAKEYCIFTGSDEKSCQELADELPKTKSKPFFYKRDEYFTKPLTLPAGSSALIINGGLDFQTPTEFGELLYKKLEKTGDGVLMVTFDYGNHCAGEAVELAPPVCRDGIVSQYIVGSGDVNVVSTECMSELPSLSFAVDGTEEAEEAPTTKKHNVKKHSKKHHAKKHHA